MKKCVLLGLAIIVAGCATAQKDPTLARLEKQIAESKRFNEATMGLSTGMTREEVVGLLGAPEYAEARTAGADVGEPWKAMVWRYPKHRFICYVPTEHRRNVEAEFMDEGALIAQERAD